MATEIPAMNATESSPNVIDVIAEEFELPCTPGYRSLVIVMRYLWGLVQSTALERPRQQTGQHWCRWPGFPPCQVIRF